MNESVRFGLHSKDVIHAFWVPAFRLQEDVVPGITMHYRATPDRLGTYPIVCNLLCGVGHSLMRSPGPRRHRGQVPGMAQEPRGRLGRHREHHGRLRRRLGVEHDGDGCGIMSAMSVCGKCNGSDGETA